MAIITHTFSLMLFNKYLLIITFKICILQIHLPVKEVPIKMGVCLPSSCDYVDVKTDIIHTIDFFCKLYYISIYLIR